MTEQGWTIQSSLHVHLIVVENEPNPTHGSAATGRFDGITLEVFDLDDRIFADGFEP